MSQSTLDHHPTQGCTVGQRYTTAAPDTLDLADRMELAINALTRVWYPEEQWALGFMVDFSRRPPVHYANATTMDAFLIIPAKFIEALIFCRLATGNSDRLEVDRQVMEAQLSFLGSDGLSYTPEGPLPQVTRRWGAEVAAEGRQVMTLSMLSQVDDDPRWLAIARRKVDRMLELSREKEGFRYFWKGGNFRPHEVVPEDADEPSGKNEGGGHRDFHPEASMVTSVGMLGHGSALLYRLTEYEPARELSRGLAHWALARLFNRADGRHEHWHFHLGLYTLMAVCAYADAVRDREILERVDACYRWSREMGDPLVGFYPEHLWGTPGSLERHGNSVEICEVADMVFLALYLTRAGVGDYWDDVDQWVRNMLSEGQMRHTEFLDRIPDDCFNPEPSTRPHPVTDNVAEESVGSFFGWMRANDGLTIHQQLGESGPGSRQLQDPSIMHCCTANGARALYLAWDSIVTLEGNETRVNLLLNRASPWLDVDSYLPVAGKVVLHIKDAPAVSVRMPQWCDPNTVAVTVSGQPRQALVDGQRLKLRWLEPGDEVTLKFPVPERVLPRVIGEFPFKLTLRGANVVDIEPGGVGYPLYEDQPTGRLIDRTRFIAEKRGVVW